MKAEEFRTSAVTAAMYERTRTTPSGTLRSVVAVEHMPDWERLTRDGSISCYLYDPDQGYVLTADGAQTIAARDYAREHLVSTSVSS